MREAREGSGGEDIENRFQGLVVFLIGLTNLFAAYTIDQAKNFGLQVSSPSVIMWVFGILLVIAGIIWGTIGDKIEVGIKWAG
jgi:hypothetical protein